MAQCLLSAERLVDQEIEQGRVPTSRDPICNDLGAGPSPGPGPGGKVSLTALPLIAACGGTIDKLETIPGWSR